MIRHRSTCRLCDSASIELVVELEPIPLAEKYSTTQQEARAVGRYPIDLYMCSDCGHVQCLDVIESDKLWSDYTYHSAQTKGIVEHFNEVAAKIVAKYKPAPDSLVIDVGSNDGSLLRPFLQAGLAVLGIDPAREIAAKASQSGITTVVGLCTPDLAQSIASSRKASVITAFNVFAHADDMAGMTDAIRTMLAPDGVFVFEVQYLLDIIDKMLLGTIFHEHMSHHSLRPLKRFLDAHGLELIDIERVTIQHGSIIGVAQHKGGDRPIHWSVREMMELEDRRLLWRPETIKRFGTKLGEMRSKAQDLASAWRRNGATVAGYGAARSGPTFLAQLGLGSSLQFILDDHPQKVGLYSPGDGIQVLPTAELYQRNPDYVVILAWIHAKQIIAAHQRYLDGAGRFVTLCPDVQVT